jgi:phosphoribosylanthranilate isomerase
MTFLVKICGLSDETSVDAALEAGADMLGFVFFEASPRHLSFARGKALASRAKGRARKVALSVNADDATLAAIVEAVSPDVLQLHGSESPERVSAIRSRFGLQVMRAFPIREHGDATRIAAFDEVADHLLFDAQPALRATRPGGNGEAFDWTLLDNIETRRPWFLAGGLTIENAAAAVASTRAHGVDVSSGVESAPGRKDPEKIARFVSRARAGYALRLEREGRSSKASVLRSGLTP